MKRTTQGRLPADKAGRVPDQDTQVACVDGGLAADVRDRLEHLSQQATVYATRSRGAGTRATYASAWRMYTAWCDQLGLVPLSGDPGQLALYLTQRAQDGLAVSSLHVARAAVRAAHKLARVPLDLDDERLSAIMEGIVRTKGRRPQRQASAAVPDLLRRLLAAVPAPNTPEAAAAALAARHRAMMLIGFGAALRRSELVALTVGDVSAVDARGLTVLVRRAKGDQHGHGRTMAVHANHAEPAFCPVAAYQRWMAMRRTAADWGPGTLASQDDLPLFCAVTSGGGLTGRAMADKIVARLLKQAAVQAGLDPERFSGHSLRRGLLTDAGDRQLPLADLVRHSRHRSVATALGYLEAGDLWRNNITDGAFRPNKR